MKLRGNEKIAKEIGTYFGVLTWIDWANNRGRVRLDPRPGDDPNADPAEVECTFRYADRRWLWNMDAYPDEDIASHSAFAFCHGDSVMLIHPAPPRMIERDGKQVADPDSPKYAAVAVLKEIDDGQGGKTWTYDRRNPWPVYRLGHEALVLNFKYAGLGDKGAGFPFLADETTREYQNPFVDQRGHLRAFGTPEEEGGTGNPRLVVTREMVATPGVGWRTCFIPHAVHEFCGPGEDIPYVPDVLSQTTPNWRGRIVGWSSRDELLIDNIPVARVTGDTDAEAVLPSWKAVTRKIIHLDEAANRVTVLHIVMDCNYDWRPREQSGDPYAPEPVYWCPPQYAFYVLSGAVDLTELCIYAAMETPREELPVIELLPDADASWTWQDLKQREPTFLASNQPNLCQDVDIAYPGYEAEMFFWGGLPLTGDKEQAGQRRKISLVIASGDDGSIRIDKRIGELEPHSRFNEDNLTAFVEFDEYEALDQQTGETVNERCVCVDNATLKRPVSDTAARLGDISLDVEVNGHDIYFLSWDGATAHYDTYLTKTYKHVAPQNSFDIAEEVQILQGERPYRDEYGFLYASRYNDNGGLPDDNVLGTISMIIFTHIDLRHGLYGFWEVVWMEDMRLQDLVRSDRSNTGKKVIWLHHLKSADYDILTHIYEVDFPHGPVSEDTAFVNRHALKSLVFADMINNPGVPYFYWNVYSSHFAGGERYCHNVWNLPRFEIDGKKMTHDMDSEYMYELCRRYYRGHIFWPPYWSPDIENTISTWLHGTTWLFGTKRATVTMNKRGIFSKFSLCPLPSKDIGIWPYYKNYCFPYGTNTLFRTDHADASGGLAHILFTECMEFEGVCYGGEFSYQVKVRAPEGMDPYPVQCDSPGMADLRKCTGRDDATISLE